MTEFFLYLQTDFFVLVKKYPLILLAAMWVYGYLWHLSLISSSCLKSSHHFQIHHSALLMWEMCEIAVTTLISQTHAPCHKGIMNKRFEQWIGSPSREVMVGEPWEKRRKSIQLSMERKRKKSDMRFKEYFLKCTNKDHLEVNLEVEETAQVYKDYYGDYFSFFTFASLLLFSIPFY